MVWFAILMLCGTGCGMTTVGPLSSEQACLGIVEQWKDELGLATWSQGVCVKDPG